MSVPAGWYPDPAAPTRARWWDGQAWTSSTSALPTAAPVPAPVPAPVTAPPAPPPPPAVAPSSPAPGTGDPSAVSRFGGPSSPGDPGLTPGPPPGLPGGDVVAFTRAKVRPQRRGSSGERRTVAAILAVVLAGVGGYAYHASHSVVEPPAPPSAAPAPTPLASAAADLQLDTFQPPDNTPFRGVRAVLVPRGDQLVTPTLTGWCGATFSTDRARIARRQWVYMRGKANAGVSVEVVAYSSDAQASKAYDEFVSVTARCHRHVEKRKDGTITYSTVLGQPFVPGDADHARGFVSVLSMDLRAAKTGARTKAYMFGAPQVRGQFLTVVWVAQRQPFDRTALDLLNNVAVAQSIHLGEAPLT